jgi:hypothetical protein
MARGAKLGMLDYNFIGPNGESNRIRVIHATPDDFRGWVLDWWRVDVATSTLGTNVRRC